MQFWDTEPAKPVFDYDVEKKRFIDNMEYLSTMPVEEQTLYKKWQEWNSDLPKSMARKPSLAKSFDMIWTPTDIYNKELTIKEIEEFHQALRSGLIFVSVFHQWSLLQILVVI